MGLSSREFDVVFKFDFLVLWMEKPMLKPVNFRDQIQLDSEFN